MSTPKELHFFSDDGRYPHALNEYRRYFVEGAGATYRGESSTTYMIFPDVAERIGATIPDPRFIFVLRNPIDRVWSHYRWLKTAGSEHRPLREAFLADLHDVPNFEANVDGNFFFYGLESRYGSNLRRYYHRFGPERILVLTMEQLRDDPDSALRQCTKFLELAPMTVEQSLDENRTPPDRWPRTRKLIAELSVPTAAPHRRQGIVGPLRSMIARSLLLTKFAHRLLQSLNDKGYSRLPVDDREWLRSFYVDEVAEARELSGQSFAEWEGDFPPLRTWDRT